MSKQNWKESFKTNVAFSLSEKQEAGRMTISKQYLRGSCTILGPEDDKWLC